MGKTETGLDSIKCPGCGEVIPISETIYHQVAERAERELQAKSVRQERALAEREKQLQAREEEFDRRVQEQVKRRVDALSRQPVRQCRPATDTAEMPPRRRRPARLAGRRSLTQPPVAVIHSPAEIVAA